MNVGLWTWRTTSISTLQPSWEKFGSACRRARPRGSEAHLHVRLTLINAAMPARPIVILVGRSGGCSRCVFMLGRRRGSQPVQELEGPKR